MTHLVHEETFYHKVDGFSPRLFNCYILRRFTALTNVQELGIDGLNIPKFLPRIRRYFGHFLPTVRSLAMRSPRGSRRQIIYFIGLFQHLEDLKLLSERIDSQDEPAGEPMLTPLSAPPLRGRLAMTCFTRVGFLEDMIDLLGGIRFHHMDLCNVNIGSHSCWVLAQKHWERCGCTRGRGVSLEGVRAPANAVL